MFLHEKQSIQQKFTFPGPPVLKLIIVIFNISKNIWHFGYFLNCNRPIYSIFIEGYVKNF